VFDTTTPLQNTSVNVIFTDGFTPLPNLKKRRVAQTYMPEDLSHLQREREIKDIREV